MPKPNDTISLAQLRDGTLTTDPEHGVVYRNGKPARGRNNSGYIRVQLGDNKTTVAHRIVWMSVHGPIKPGLVINHRNRKPDDNRLVNLEAITVQQNVLHATGSLAYAGIRPEDLEAVDPLWLADMLSRAAKGEAPPERGSGPVDYRCARSNIKYAI
jgi:hypothetical protein